MGSHLFAKIFSLVSLPLLLSTSGLGKPLDSKAIFLLETVADWEVHDGKRRGDNPAGSGVSDWLAATGGPSLHLLRRSAVPPTSTGPLLSVRAGQLEGFEALLGFDKKTPPPSWLKDYRWQALSELPGQISYFAKEYTPGTRLWLPRESAEGSVAVQEVLLRRAPEQKPRGWARREHILQQLKTPQVPARELQARAFGVRGDGLHDDRPLLQAALEACAQAGGGTLRVSAGRYLLKGPLHLRSRVRLHLEAGAELRFGGTPKDYLVGEPSLRGCVRTRYEGTELYHHSPLLYGCELEDVAITGEGPSSVIHGGRLAAEDCPDGSPPTPLWTTSDQDRSRLRDLGDQGVPVHQRIFGEGTRLRVPLFQFLLSKRLLFENFRTVHSPFWNLVVSQCEEVTIRGLSARNYNPNSDGIDIDGSRQVLIEDCDIEAADDAIALKSGRDADGWRVACPSEDIVIRNCRLTSLWGDLALGSEMSAGIRNVFISGCGPRPEPPTRFPAKAEGFWIMLKSNFDRGGSILDIYIEDTAVETLTTSHINYGYRGGKTPALYSGLHLRRLPKLRELNMAEKADARTRALELEACPGVHLKIYEDPCPPTPEQTKNRSLPEGVPLY